MEWEWVVIMLFLHQIISHPQKKGSSLFLCTAALQNSSGGVMVWSPPPSPFPFIITSPWFNLFFQRLAHIFLSFKRFPYSLPFLPKVSGISALHFLHFMPFHNHLLTTTFPFTPHHAFTCTSHHKNQSHLPESWPTPSLSRQQTQA